MGKGKAKRRRQQNYEAAHGTGLKLAPPPEMKDVNAIPSKLRAIMNLMDPGRESRGKKPPAPEKIKKTEKNANSTATASNENAGDTDQNPKKSESKKRKRNAGLEEFAEKLKENTGAKSRERRKSFLKERKEKKKQKQLDAIDKSLQQLYKHEDVKFGDVVQAPPKLPRLRHKDKSAAAATPTTAPSLVSQERRRLQAVEAYRTKRDWQSRPGSRLDPSNPS